MRGGYGERLRDFVERVDSKADLIAEVVIREDSHVITTQSQWNAGSETGSISSLESGGVTLSPSTNSLILHSVSDATFSGGESGSEFNALLVSWLGGIGHLREFNALAAHIDPRIDGGQPKTASEFVMEVYRVAEVLDPAILKPQLIARSAPVAAAGEVAADFIFSFHSQVRPGAPPTGPGAGTFPRTLFVLRAYQSDGSPADNVAWLGDSATDSKITAAYDAAPVEVDFFETAGIWAVAENSLPFPRMNLVDNEYVEGTVTFDGAQEIPDLSGTGDLVLVARGEEPGDSALTFEISDDGGSSWEEFVDGDLVGEDNTARGGGDLSAVSPSGPWDMRVTLTPSSSGLSAPTAREIGVERLQSTSLAGIAEVQDAVWQVAPLELKGNITAGDIAILKTGEKDYLDYGSDLLVANHIGQLEVRVYVGDPTGRYLEASEWMLHSVFEIEDFRSEDDRHVLRVASPLARARRRIPPFVVTSGNDGSRTATTVSGSLKDCYEEILDTMLALPARWRGPGIEDDTTTANKLLTDSDAKDELDALAYLAGGCVTESQGRIAFKRIMRDNPAQDRIVAAYPLGSYTPVHIGPGFSARTDEFFVKHSFDVNTETFDERRYLNAIAFEKLGGRALDTTYEVPEEIARWIDSESGADAVGQRQIKHFANGMIVWELADCPRHPELEIGDVVLVETDRFVGRSPITDEEIRGPLWATAIVIAVRDFWGERVDVWVPGWEHLVVQGATVTTSGFSIESHVLEISHSFALDGQLSVSIRVGPSAASVRVAVASGSDPSAATIGAATAHNVDADGFVRITGLGIFGQNEVAHTGVIAYTGASGAGHAFAVARMRATATTGRAGNTESVDDAPSNEVARSVQSGIVTGTQFAGNTPDEEYPVTFPVPFNAAPVVAIVGYRVKSFDSGLGTGSDQTLVLEAKDVAATGFTLVAKLVGGSPTLSADGDDFTAGSDLDTVSETVSCTLASLSGTVFGDAYTVNYSVNLQVTADPGDTFYRATVVVAFDTVVGGVPTERATQSYQRDALSGGTETLTVAHATKVLNVPGLTSSDAIRIRIKSITEIGDGQIDDLEVHGFNVATDGDAAEGVTWQEESVAATEAPAATGAEHFVAWEAKSAA